MIKEEYKYSDITEKVIGCAMKVHNTLGNGFQACLPKGQQDPKAGGDLSKSARDRIGKKQITFRT